MNSEPKLSTTKPDIPIGISDFKEMRDGSYYYIDKTGFISEIVNASAKVILLPRPRRFGKTLNMSMLRYFFEKSEEDLSSIFAGLAICHQEVFSKQGEYPVIWLTFKDARNNTWTGCEKSIQDIIYEEYARHRYLLESNALYAEEKNYILNIINKTLEQTEYERALKYLSAYLHRHHQERVIILIDEYDAPFHAGYTYGYYDDVINFMRNFLSSGLKDNTHLFKGILTGILRVAKESVFSGLNNLGVYTLLVPRFSDSFGFTESEVRSLLQDYTMGDHYDRVSHWYNGYNFGNTVIYNPWSVLNYIDNQGRADTYWVNTGNPTIIESLLLNEKTGLREELGQLVEGNTIRKPVYDSIVMKDLQKRDDLLWGFLLFSGYLKCTGDAIRKNYYELKAPNEEVRRIYEEIIQRWFTTQIGSTKVENLLKALTSGNVDEFGMILANMVETVVSFHDTGEPAPENFYHAFVLGLLVWLEGIYQVRSNRESGYGRYDVLLLPEDHSKQGIILEFKKIDTHQHETPEQALEKAMKQIEEKRYAAELEAAGIQNILKIAIAFRGKEVWVREG